MSSSTYEPPSSSSGEKAPLTYRGVRNLKHKNDRVYQESLKKSNSLQNLAVNNGGTGEKYAEARSALRSMSGDRSGVPRVSLDARTVSMYDSQSASSSVHGSNASSSLSMLNNSACVPKTLYESLLDESIQSNQSTPPQVGGYRSLARLPMARSIDDYAPMSSPEPMMRQTARRKSATSLELERVESTNIVSNTARIFEERSLVSQDSCDYTVPPYGNISRDRSRPPSTSSAFSSAQSSRVGSPSPAKSMDTLLLSRARPSRYDIAFGFLSNSQDSEVSSPRDRYKNETDELKVGCDCLYLRVIV